MLLGTCPQAVVRCVLCALSGLAATGRRCCLVPVPVPWLWPAACLSGVHRGPARCAAPCPVGSLLVLRLAFLTPWCLSPPRGLAPPALLGGCAGHAEAGREPGSLCLPLAPAEAGALGSLRAVPVLGPAMRLSLAGPSGICLGLRALRWLVCVDPFTHASGFPYRPSFDGGLRPCTGAVLCGRRHLPLRVGGRHAPVPCVCASAHPSWPGRAGRPPGRVLVRLTFSSGRFVFLLCSAPSGLGLPLSWSFVCPPIPLFFFFSVVVFRAPPSFLAFFGFRPRVPWALALCVVCSVGLALLGSPRALASFELPARLLAALWWLPPPPPFCVSRCSLLPLGACCFFFPLPVSAPVLSGFLWFPAPGALGLGAVLRFLLFLASRPSALRALLPVLCLPVVAAPPPPPLCVAVFVAAARCLVFFPLPVCAPVIVGFLWFLALGALDLGAVFCWFCGPPAARLSVRSRLVCVSRLAVGCSLVVAVPPTPCCVSRFSLPPLGAPILFFFLHCAPPLSLALCAPLVSGGLWFPALGALGLCAVRCLLFWLPASRLTLRSRLFRASRLAVGCSLVVAAPRPILCLAVFVAAAPCCVSCAVLCCVSLGAVLRGAAARCADLVLCCCLEGCFVALVWCRCLLCCALWRCPSPWGPVLCGPVLCGVPPRCVLCGVCVFRGVLVRAVVRRSALCCVCPGALCCAFPVLSALCGAVLRCAGALALCGCALFFGVLWCDGRSGGL